MCSRIGMAAGDFVVLAAVLLASLLAFGYRFLPAAPSATPSAVPAAVPTVEVRMPGREAHLLPVDAQFAWREKKHWELEGAAGGLRLAFVPERGFHVYDADCPDHICVRTGFIDRAGQSIVCVPNAIVIRLIGGVDGGSGGDGGNDFDAVLR